MRTSTRNFLVLLTATSLFACIQWSERPMTKKIVFLGDSLTQQFDWQRRFPGYSVMNLGISGEPVEGLLARREAIRANVQKPDYIFIMTGINNIALGEYEIAPPYRELVRNLTTWYKGSTVVIQSILPVELPGPDNSVIEEANRQLAQVAREHHAEYLDLYSLFVDEKRKPRSEFLNDDGVHLTGKGYEAWSKAVERFLQGR